MDNTWANAKTHKSWPELITEDPQMADYDVYVYGYDSPKFAHSSKIYEISTRLGEQLHYKGFFADYSEISFITHSMGGLVTKRMLDTLNTPNDIDNLQKVRCVIYVSVPSRGAEAADLASWISANPQFANMSAGETNDFLNVVEQDWQELLNARDKSRPYPRTFSAYETKPTGPMKVVPAIYISPMSDSRTIAFDYDHVDIVKPDALDNDVYEWARGMMLSAANAGHRGNLREDKNDLPRPTEQVVQTPPVMVRKTEQQSQSLPLGARYVYYYPSRDGIQCLGQIVKKSTSEWYEGPSPETPTTCQASAGFFAFVETSAENQQVTLYDQSRNVYLRLDQTKLGEMSPVLYREGTDTHWGALHVVTRQQ